MTPANFPWRKTRRRALAKQRAALPLSEIEREAARRPVDTRMRFATVKRAPA